MTQSSDDAKPSAPPIVKDCFPAFDNEARSLLGDAYGEARHDADGSIRLAVIDLTEDQRIALRALARRLGIEDWVRIERADPTHLETWEQLRQELLEMRELEPRVLQGYPTPEAGYRRPPIRINLAATAETTAADLHERYGDFVSLRVGVFAYPAAPIDPDQDNDRSRRARPDEPVLSPDELTVVLAEPLTVRTGETARTALLFTNHSDQVIALSTNGFLTAKVLDPESGCIVGGSTLPQRMPGVGFKVEPGQTTSVPLIVGTASFDSTLGYTLPEGTWQLVAPIKLRDGRQLMTPQLEFSISS